MAIQGMQMAYVMKVSCEIFVIDFAPTDKRKMTIWLHTT